MPKGDRELLKADIEDGSTAVANLLLEALAAANISGVQKGLVLFLIRRTYGWVKDSETNERFKEDRITLNEWTAAVDSERSYVSRQLRDLIDNKKIIKERPDPSDRRYKLYTINTMIDEWDNSCLNKQRLIKNTTQQLFKNTTVSLSKYTTVDPPQSLDNTEPNGRPKEILNKDINKSTSTKVDEQAQQKLPKLSKPKNKPKNKEPKYSEDDKAVANYLKNKLKERGVTALPRNWHLKEYAIAQRLLKKSSVSELRECINWLFTDDFWHDKVDSLLTVERQLPKFQLRKGAIKNGRADPTRGNNQGANKQDDLDELVIR